MNKYLILVGLTLGNCLSLSALAQQPASEREIQALSIKPSVVRICNGFTAVIESGDRQQTIGEMSCGSGFFISPDGFIATNAHVVEFTHGQGGATESEVRKKFVQTVGAEPSSFNYFHHVLLPSCGEPLPFTVKQFGSPNGEGEDAAIIKVEIEHAPSLMISTDSDNVGLQDEVTIVGYPGAADQDNTCESFHEASFSRGIVSAKKSDENGNSIIQLDASISGGNSGGPVLNNNGEVIGLATAIAVNPDIGSVGIAFAVPGNKLQEFVRDAGATNTEGTTNRIYQEGLQFYQNQCYSSAIKKFEEAQQLFPKHSETERLIRYSRVAIANNEGSWTPLCSNRLQIFAISTWLWVFGAGTIVIIVGWLIIRNGAVDSL